MSSASSTPVLTLGRLCASVAKTVGAGAFALTVLAAIGVVFVAYQSAFDAEQRRLRSLAPGIGNSIASEVFIGDRRAAAALERELGRRYGIDSVSLDSVSQGACVRPGSAIALLNRGRVHVVRPVVMRGSELCLRLGNEVPFPWHLVLVLIAAVCVPVGVFGVWLMLRLRRKLEVFVAEPIAELARDPESFRPTGPIASEVEMLRGRLKEFITERDSQRVAAEKARLEASLGRWAAQVAHDIRSPLTALTVLASEMDALPEPQRRLLVAAVQRIRGIADRLYEEQNRPAVAMPRTDTDDFRDTSATLLFSVLEGIVAEKQLEFRSRPDVHILASVALGAHGAHASVHEGHLKRCLSNLVNNSVDALEGGGTIELRLLVRDGAPVLLVRDDGVGIAADVLAQIRTQGGSHGKSSGRGLGLKHARAVAAAWGGDFVIDSAPGKGTVVELRLRPVSPPPLFVPRLQVPAYSTVVVLDDDQSVHELWDRRLRAQGSGNHIDMVHFATPDQLFDWHRDDGRANRASTMYLVDFQLSRNGTDGIEVVRRLGIAGSTVLVTNSHEEPDVLQRCRALGLRLLPKALAPHVDIAF